MFANTYADDNAAEYFAEGVQDWYNTNQVPRLSGTRESDGVHNEINTKTELQKYDPMLYALLGTVLPVEPKWKDCYWYENE